MTTSEQLQALIIQTELAIQQRGQQMREEIEHFKNEVAILSTEPAKWQKYTSAAFKANVDWIEHSRKVLIGLQQDLDSLKSKQSKLQGEGK